VISLLPPKFYIRHQRAVALADWSGQKSGWRHKELR
jgi:hypothetical protein